MPRRNRAKHTSKMSDFKPDKWYPGDVMCPVCIKYVDKDGREIFPRINKFYRVGVHVRVPSPNAAHLGLVPDRSTVEFKMERKPVTVVVTYSVSASDRPKKTFFLAEVTLSFQRQSAPRWGASFRLDVLDVSD